MLIKVFITIALFYILIRKVDLSAVLLQLRSMQLIWGLLALAALLLQLFLAGMRWHLVCQLLNAKLDLRNAIRLVFIGQFFNQLLPSSVGGDAIRVWMTAGRGMSLGKSISSIFCDRLVGLLILILLGSITILIIPITWQPEFLATKKLFYPFVLILAVFFCIYFAGNSFSKILLLFKMLKPIGVLIRDFKIIIFSNFKSLQIVIISFVIQILIITVAYLLAKGMNAELSYSNALVLIPTIMFVSMVPISFAGWGIREGAMVVGLGYANVSAAHALAISLSFGLAQIVIGLPGGYFWLKRRQI